ncbi:hypothetical protein [Streptomyces sp. NPDC047097]|uniref:hypothetical protein n=1 Tax=Streptomyces sp. NPDC047097 TaxID=3155260 RepID=UPI0033DF19F3
MAAVLTGVLGTGQATASVSPTAHSELGLLAGGTTNRAFAVNQQGLVVGDSGTVTSSGHAVVWNAQGTPTDLGVLPGDTTSTAFSVSNNGRNIGGRSIGRTERAVRWGKDRRMTELPGRPDAVRTRVYGVNDSGTAVGFSVTADGNWHPLRWCADGMMTELAGLPGAVSSGTTWINNRGVTGGWSSTADGRKRAVLWAPDGTIRALPSLPGHGDVAVTAINDSGVAVGGSSETEQSESYFAVKWTSDGKVETLPALPGDIASNATAVNRTGHAVGYSVTPQGVHRPVRWKPDGSVSALDTVTPGVGDAYGIADDGKAVGVVVATGEQPRAWLWK